jgi:hypothetical protein
MRFLSVQTLDFPINCLHAGIVEFLDGPQIYDAVYSCCLKCHYPKYLACTSEDNPDWLCASRAYKCMCDCRETHLSKSGLLINARKSMSSFKSKSKFKSKSRTQLYNVKYSQSQRFCEKKICNRISGYGCCMENQCIRP